MDTRSLSNFYYNNYAIDGIPTESPSSISKKILAHLEADEFSLDLRQHYVYLWMLKRIKKKHRVSVADTFNIHYKLFDGMGVDDNGVVRTKPRKIRDYDCPLPKDVWPLLKEFDLLLSISDDIKEFDNKQRNLYFWHVHNVFQCIHPFSYGNGRVGRFLFNMLRLRNDMDISAWEVESDIYFEEVKKFEPVFNEKYYSKIKAEGNSKLG